MDARLREGRAAVPRAGVGFRALVAMPADSPPAPAFLRAHRLQLPLLGPAHLAEDLHLRLEHDAEAVVDLPAGRRHHREDVGGRRPAGVLDEVGVLGREARAADREAAAAGRIEQLAGGAALGARIARDS